MRPTRRRRLDVAILGLGGVAIGGVAAIAALAGDTERVTGMWVGAALDGNGDAAIAEVIDYDFGLAVDKHGIFRTIPGLTEESPVEVRSASAPDDIAAKTQEIVGGELGIRLKIGSPHITITGRHRYAIDYALPSLAGGGRLAWDAVGTGWTVPVALAEVHVVAPWQFTGLICSKGTTGTSGGCELTQPEPGHLVAKVARLDEGEGITIAADRGEALTDAPSLPAPPIDAPPDPGSGIVRPAGVAALSAIGASAVGSVAVRRRGRERVGATGATDAAWADLSGPTGEVRLDHEELAAMATTEFAPPENLTAPQGGVVFAESVREEHKVAWLIEAAIGGSIELVEEGGKPVRLVRRDGGPDEPKAVLDTMFAGRSHVDLGSYDPSFSAGWAKVAAALDSWRHHSGFWELGANRRRTIVRGLGGLLTIIGAVAVGVTALLAARWGEGWLLPLGAAGAAAGLGFAAALRGWELRVRTPAGSAAWLRVESFRRFLAGSEAFHAEEAAKRGVLREYTAWAVAIGEIDRWQRAVAGSTALPQDAGVSYVHMAPLLAASTSSTSTEPSSSGSGGGGGGGGSVGGGGGGGGGGSW